MTERKGGGVRGRDKQQGGLRDERQGAGTVGRFFPRVSLLTP
jgi:hypothetical protein